MTAIYTGTLSLVYVMEIVSLEIQQTKVLIEQRNLFQNNFSLRALYLSEMIPRTIHEFCQKLTLCSLSAG